MMDDTSDQSPAALVADDIVPPGLSQADLEMLDAWIAKRPEPRPSRLQVITDILSLALVHDEEIDQLQISLMHVESDVRYQFRRDQGIVEFSDAGEFFAQDLMAAWPL